ncbi:hypothetical protein ACFE04_021591 [Oxalis oulophora]
MEGIQLVDFLIREVAIEHLDVQQLLSSTKSFNIADLIRMFDQSQHICCSPKYYRSRVVLIDKEILQFHVFFNDDIANDFNTLIKSLPSQLYDRASLFPNACIQFSVFPFLICTSLAFKGSVRSS